MRWIMTRLGVCVVSFPIFTLKFHFKQRISRFQKSKCLTSMALLCMQSMLAHQTGNLLQVGVGMVTELVEGNTDIEGDLQGEALMPKTYAAHLVGGEASAPAAAT